MGVLDGAACPAGIPGICGGPGMRLIIVESSIVLRLSSDAFQWGRLGAVVAGLIGQSVSVVGPCRDMRALFRCGRCVLFGSMWRIFWKCCNRNVIVLQLRYRRKVRRASATFQIVLD